MVCQTVQLLPAMSIATIGPQCIILLQINIEVRGLTKQLSRKLLAAESRTTAPVSMLGFYGIPSSRVFLQRSLQYFPYLWFHLQHASMSVQAKMIAHRDEWSLDTAAVTVVPSLVSVNCPTVQCAAEIP
jgi:hypothetical protein